MRKFSLAIALAAYAAFFVPANAQMGLIEDERLLGNDSGAQGQVQQITVGGGLDFNGSGSVVVGDAELACIRDLTSAADTFAYFTGSGTCALAGVTSFARSILDDTDEATFKATVNLEIGTDVQAHGDVLDDLNSLGAAASDGQIIVATGAGAFAYESGATARTSLGVSIGTDVQAWDEELDDIAGLSVTKGNIIGATGSAWGSLGVGTDGQCLIADSGETTGLVWGSCGGVGGLPADPGFDAVLLWDDTTDNQAEWHTRLPVANGGTPVGGLVFIPYTDTCPTGTVKANGATNLSRTTYPDLFAVYGTTFGNDDGSTFGVPDLTTGNRFVRASDGTTITAGTMQTHQLQSHNHYAPFNSGATGTSLFAVSGTRGATSPGPATNTSGDTGNFGSETRPNNFAAAPCIYY